jgi:hypothetical protein
MLILLGQKVMAGEEVLLIVLVNYCFIYLGFIEPLGLRSPNWSHGCLAAADFRRVRQSSQGHPYHCSDAIGDTRGGDANDKLAQG